MALSLKQRKFIAAYTGACNGNATAAARAAGYANPNSAAYDILTNESVAAAIDDLYGDNKLGSSEILSRLSDQARGPGQYLKMFPKTKLAYLDLAALQRDGKGHIVTKLIMSKYGQTVEFADAQAALIQLGRHHKLFTDRIDFSNVDAEVDAAYSRIVADAKAEALKETGG